MSYDPPSETNWYYTHCFMDCYRNAYDAGYRAAREGAGLDASPYKESGLERELTHQDELGYWWYKGWSAWEN